MGAWLQLHVEEGLTRPTRHPCMPCTDQLDALPRRLVRFHMASPSLHHPQLLLVIKTLRCSVAFFTETARSMSGLIIQLTAQRYVN